MNIAKALKKDLIPVLCAYFIIIFFAIIFLMSTQSVDKLFNMVSNNMICKNQLGVKIIDYCPFWLQVK